MNIKINNEPIDLEDGTTVAMLAEKRNVPAGGVAIAVNDRLVRRADWTGRELADGDEVVIISATYGG